MADEKKQEAKQEVKLPKYRVKIHSGTDEADKVDVFLAHNYSGIQIKRDEEVIIDENYVNALKQSMIHTFVKEAGVDKPVQIPRFSYEISPV